jgi:hypothetical protein
VLALFMLLAGGLWGCSGDSSTAPGGSITIALSGTSLTLQQGGDGSVTVSVTRIGDFGGTVAVAAEGLPAGVTAPPLSLASGQTTGALSFAAASDAATGSSQVTIRATGASVDAVTATLTLLVQATSAGGFTLSLNPAAVSVQQGASGVLGVSIARSGGFAGPVNLTASGLPQGVTASFDPAAATGNTSTLTLTAAAAATVGNASVTVTGAGPGVSDQTATLTLTIQAGAASGGNVSVAFCPLLGVPVWLAFRDGPEGDWIRSTPVNGVYSGEVASGRGAVAYVLPDDSGGFQTYVWHGTTTELQGHGRAICYGSEGTGKTVNVDVVGADPTDYLTLGLGTSSASFSMGVASAFEDVPDGTVDLVGSRATISSAGFSLNKLFVQRGLTPAAGSTVTVDFEGASAIDPVTASVTLDGLGSDQAVMSSIYRTANQTVLPYAFDTPNASTDRSYAGFPTFSGSFHMLQVTAMPSTASFDRQRTAGVVFAAVADRALTLGPDLGEVAVTTVATTPNVRPRAVIPTLAPYDQTWNFVATQSAGGSRGVVVQMSSGYLGEASATVTLTVPDLSGAAGYDPTWGLQPGSAINWVATGQSTTGFGSQGQFADGATTLFASRLGMLSNQP